jgi:sugar transferase (PEP-CTERM/EpsH1 system associated)
MDCHAALDRRPVHETTRSVIRVGHVIHALTSGGMERGVLNIVNYGDPARFRHFIMCLTRADSIVSEIRTPDCEVVELGKRPGNDWRLPARLAAVARRAGLDVLHARGWPALVETAVGAALARVKGTVYGFHGRTIRELDGLPRRRWWAQKLFVPRYRRLVTLNHRMRREFATECGVPEHRIDVIPNGVDTERFRPRADKGRLRVRFGVPADRLVIGTVARLDPVKNHALILRTVKRCLDDGIRPFVLLIGDGPHRDTIAAEVARLGLTHDVRLYGHSNEVPELLNCLDVYVQPSFYEGFSNTLLEAMACALPIVATDVGGTADLVSDGVEGWLFKSNDESALTRLIAGCRAEGARAAVGARGRQRVLTEYSIQHMVRSYEAMYTRLANDT